MEKLKDLKDLLKHEVQDLISAEDQIIEAMPAMIEMANNPELKKALSEHLRITEKQRKRLDQVQKLLGEEKQSGGLFERLFGGGQKCRGMEGLITEGQKIMSEDMNPEVLDAAIIASAQRIEHYEITGYGTAKAFAKELKLTSVAKLLEQTLNEEYEADDKLTAMAVGKLNEKAEKAGSSKARTPASATSRTTASARAKSNGAPARVSAARSASANRSAAPSSGRKSAASAVRTKNASARKSAPGRNTKAATRKNAR